MRPSAVDQTQLRNPCAAEARVEALATRTCGRRWRTSLSRGVRTVSDVAAGGTRARHGFGRSLAVGSSKFLCLAHQAHSNANFAGLTVRDLDIYMDKRARGLTRKSLKDVAERLRS